MRNPFYISSNCPKHYFAGTQRVSSKIGTTENVGDYLYDWFTQGTGGPVDVIGSSFGVLENAEDGVVQVYDELGIDPPTYDSSPVFIPVQNFVHGANENEVYWFHPDHLGSTSYITNLLGEVSQHMEYFAFGETFVEEHRSSNNSPYKFNGKELDEETGWYYYGARYYDPRISIWLSVDPMAESTMTPYQYCYQNPIILTDPFGMMPEPPDGYGGLEWIDEDDGEKWLRNLNGTYVSTKTAKIYDNGTSPWGAQGNGETQEEFNNSIQLDFAVINVKKFTITDIPTNDCFLGIFCKTESDTFYTMWGSGDGEPFRDASFFREGMDKVRYSDLMMYLGARRTGMSSTKLEAVLGILGNLFELESNHKLLKKINNDLEDPIISVTGPVIDSTRSVRTKDYYFGKGLGYPYSKGDTVLYGRESKKDSLLQIIHKLAPESVRKRDGTYIK